MTLLAILAALQAASAAPVAPIDWAAAAHRDVEAGYSLMRDNHPGFVNEEDPEFPASLQAARAAGDAAADRASDQAGYAAALGAFSTVLGDGHAGLHPVRDGTTDTPARWPGFLTAWRGDGMYVVSGEAAPGLGVGSRIISCDGKPVAELLVERLRPRAVRLHESGQWWAYGTRVLTDAANVAGDPPRSCLVEPAAGGSPTQVPLRYEAVPDDWMRRYWTASNGGFTDIGLSEPKPGTFLIGLPTFAGTEEAGKLYAALNADIARRHAALAKARAIVLDLRFNQGGSSEWSREVASSLWGKAAVETRQEAAFQPVEIWWRNSPGNIAYLRQLDGILRKAGRDDTAKMLVELADRMDKRLASGEPFTIEEPADLSKPAPKPAPVTLQTPVYVIVPGQCASACLDALDTFTSMPNVTLIGAPSSGDSSYMEVRTEKLPSGKGEAVIPLKVWKHRPRSGGEIYRPRIELRQADWSTDAFLDAIEADLSKRSATR